MRRALVFLVSLAVGCSGAEEPAGQHEHAHGHAHDHDHDHGGHASESPVERSAGTLAMVRELEALGERSGSGLSAFGNLGKLERYEQGPVPEDVGDRVEHLANHGNVLLSIGRSAEALPKFEAALEAMRGAPERFLAGTEQMLLRCVAQCHLRIGEQTNCQNDHNPDSCLLPIAGGGVHRDRTGSEAAMEAFLRVLEVTPEHQVSRWLLNVAAMTLGEHPERVPERYRIPPEAFEPAADFPRFRDVAAGAGVDVFALSGGVALEDFDGDGNLDVVTSSWNLADQLRYFRNAGDGTFEERTTAAGLTGITGGLNLSTADYDNDGDVDVLLLRGAWLRKRGRHPNSLLRNRGDGTFDDVTESAGLFTKFPTQVGAWCDFDQDGWLDLFHGNESSPKQDSPWQLFKNRGDGTFVDVASEVGLAQRGYTKGATWGDFDDDGDPDLYVSNLREANRLFENLGPDGAPFRFRDVSTQSGAHRAGNSFCTWFWDLDDDGRQDLFACTYPVGVIQGEDHQVGEGFAGLPTTHELPHAFRNLGGGRFEDVGVQLGLTRPLYVMGANFGDLDGDGWEDAYLGTGAPSFEALMPNVLYANDRGARLLDVTAAAGLGHLQKGHAISLGDVDNDGDLDVYAVMGGAYDGDTFPNALFENPGSGHAWVTLRLEGVRSPRTPIGARVELTVVDADGDRRTLHRTVSTGGSFGANSLQLEVGLGDTVALERVAVRWPIGGDPEEIEGVELGRIHRVREGEGRATVVEQPRITLSRDAGEGHAHHDH